MVPRSAILKTNNISKIASFQIHFLDKKNSKNAEKIIILLACNKFIINYL